MQGRLSRVTNSQWYEGAYKLSVAIKGFDGLVEFVTGILLLVAPSLLHAVLSALSHEALEQTGRTMHYIAENIAHVDVDLAKGGVLVVALFLLSHGIVKLVMVYCLLKEILWAYPYALAVLFGFLVYQVYVFVVHPSAGMGVFCLLDAIIIWLVWGEWRKLTIKKKERLA